MHAKRILQMAVLSTLVLTGAATGQQKPAPAAPANQVTPLKVQVVFKEYDGAKQITNLPYTVPVIASERLNMSNLRMLLGFSGPLGTEIDCGATPLGGGLYRVFLTVSRSYVSQIKPAEPHEPIFRSFRASFPLLMRNGQTIEDMMATDPVSGRVLKVDVTLRVLKQR
jgi:hypothetical protein